MLEKIVKSKILSLLVAVTLAITAGIEIYESGENIGAHHGIMVYAVYQLLQGVSALYGTALRLNTINK